MANKNVTSNTAIDKYFLPDSIDLTPDWQGLFRYAIHIVRAEVPVGNGQAFVVEMLVYGARLDNLLKANAEAGRKAGKGRDD